MVLFCTNSAPLNASVAMPPPPPVAELPVLPEMVQLRTVTPPAAAVLNRKPPPEPVEVLPERVLFSSNRLPPSRYRPPARPLEVLPEMVELRMVRLPPLDATPPPLSFRPAPLARVLLLTT